MVIHPHPTFEALTEVQRGCVTVAEIPGLLAALPEADITGLFAHLMRLRALAEGAALAVLVQAQERGLVTASDYAGPAQWVRGVVADQADTIVPTGLASAMVKTAAAAGAGLGADAGGSRIADLAIAGRIGTQQAAPIVREFAAMRRQLPVGVWDAACEALVEFVADGATPKQVAAAHEAIVASYGDEGELKQSERVRRDLRSFGQFRPDRTGMYAATLRLDPESYAQVEAVIGAHCRPDPLVRDERGNPLTRDPRDREQRRADALVDILTNAGTDPTADSGRPGTAARAQLIVTLNVDDLVAAGFASPEGCGAQATDSNKDADRADHGGAERGETDHGGTERGGTDHGGADHGGTERGGAERGEADHGGTERRGARGRADAAAERAERHDGGERRDSRGTAEHRDSGGATAPMGNAVREREAGARGAAAGTGPAATARGGMGVTEHGQPISAAFLRRLACHADLTPVVLDHPGAVLWTGRRFRFATARQLAALHVRDAGCSFPGCDRPPSWCQAHHIHHWIDGGPTDLDNLALLCERHHHVVHSRGYTATATNAGVTWHTPSHRHARTPEAAPIDLLTRLHQRHNLNDDPRREPNRRPPGDDVITA